ncbi:hypothetical protein THAOC_14227, partial [Thalassiosira oceanica]
GCNYNDDDDKEEAEEEDEEEEEEEDDDDNEDGEEEGGDEDDDEVHDEEALARPSDLRNVLTIDLYRHRLQRVTGDVCGPFVEGPPLDTWVDEGRTRYTADAQTRDSRTLGTSSTGHIADREWRGTELYGQKCRIAKDLTMQNENGENVDLYIPRKCSWTNRLIRAKDHGSVQINVANVDPVTGLYTGETTAYCLSGYIRDKSEGDMAFTALVEENDKKAAQE